MTPEGARYPWVALPRNGAALGFPERSHIVELLARALVAHRIGLVNEKRLRDRHASLSRVKANTRRNKVFAFCSPFLLPSFSAFSTGAGRDLLPMPKN